MAGKPKLQLSKKQRCGPVRGILRYAQKDREGHVQNTQDWRQILPLVELVDYPL